MITDATYLLPVRSEAAHPRELTEYLETLAAHLPVVVVDASPDEVFDAVHPEWSRWVRHVRPCPDLGGANGKVRGVLSGVRLVDTELVVIADDDVRYTPASLRSCLDAMAGADLLRPQNHFDPVPWHARWDTARTLLNRATGGDFPGTLLVRRSYLAAGYDGDVLFENLELMRTVAARGGRCRSRPDLFVARRPPSTRHFLGQRVRQAYDEFARPVRLAVWLSVAPVVGRLVVRRRIGSLLAGVGAAVVVAEAGRRRAGGRAYFPATSSLLAPWWIAERAVCSWLAVGRRLRGGVPYAGTTLRRAATPSRVLRRGTVPAPIEGDRTDPGLAVARAG